MNMNESLWKLFGVIVVTSGLLTLCCLLNGLCDAPMQKFNDVEINTEPIRAHFVRISKILYVDNQTNSARQATAAKGKPKQKNDTLTTNPAAYPRNGTGETVDVSKDFNPAVLNSFCENVALTLIIPVYTVADRFERRTTIRKTVGKTCANLTHSCKMFFIAGFIRDNQTMQKLKAEYLSQRDILVIDKLDTYRDLNNKAAAMLTWLDTHCPTARFVLHITDDVYPNMKLFLSVLLASNETDYITGYPMEGRRPLRSGHWMVTKEDHPSDVYPTYVAGTAYAFPMPVAKRLKSALHSAKYCWIEDVWLTGYVREKSGIKMKPLPIAFNDNPDRRANFSTTIFYHHLNNDDFHYFYNVSIGN